MSPRIARVAKKMVSDARLVYLAEAKVAKTKQRKEVICYRCGETGHKLAYCLAPKAVPRDPSVAYSCYYCGQPKHKANRCLLLKKNGQSTSSAISCNHCGQIGHVLGQCPLKQGASSAPVQQLAGVKRTQGDVASSGGTQQFGVPQSSVTVPNQRKTLQGQMTCYGCGKVGHKKSQCRSQRPVSRNIPGTPTCYHCGQPDHKVKRCPQWQGHSSRAGGSAARSIEASTTL